MPDLRIDLTVRPSTVAAAVYGVLRLVSEHTSSLARLDDVRVALDELFHALPPCDDVRVELEVAVDDGRTRICFDAHVRDVLVHPSVAALTDELQVEHGPDTTRAVLTVAHG